MLSVALALSRRADRGTLTEPEIAALVCHLRDETFADRARRLAAYVGGVDTAQNKAALAGLAERLARPERTDQPIPFAEFRAHIERIRYAAVFTAHPTFALPAEVAGALVRLASTGGAVPSFASHRPRPIRLDDEFAAATAAISNGRDALDRLNAALLSTACAVWPDRWQELKPRPIVFASWVGYDIDGRTDIAWWDTLGYRLRMKALQYERLAAAIAGIKGVEELAARLAEAQAAVAAQIDCLPANAETEQIAAFAQALIGRRAEALTEPKPLLDLFAGAIAAAEKKAKLELAVARAGLLSHGLALAHTHVRLNASQIHNVVRQRLGLADPPADRARRRRLLSAINAALEAVTPVAVDFGALIAEQASAARLMMTVAQILKHIDGSVPVRFLIAETDTGYTLLAALWLARLFGVAEQVEITPLFETEEALADGPNLLEEALRSPHWRQYLRQNGRLCLQFGYSDSGRYVGQLAASYLIERLRLKVVEALRRHDLTDIEVVLFDTHGESVGRGGHPDSLADRLRYLSPPAARAAFREAGIRLREESSLQGGDGYLLFGTIELALAAVARIAAYALDESRHSAPDPVYADSDFVADFFASIGHSMRELVEDPGYAALLGAFGPELIDPAGSRPPVRQEDGLGGPAVIRHPREMRAIPNNAILQQLGWCANSLQGLGPAAARHPETFAEMRESSPRFRHALALATRAISLSDIDVLRAMVATLDPGTWLDRAAHARLPGRTEALMAVARGLERLGVWAPVQAMFRRIHADHLMLRASWPEAPGMPTRTVLLHAVRLFLIHRLWLLATEIPDFSPRYGLTRSMLESRLLRLDVVAAVALLERIFPAAPDPAAERDFGEPPGPRAEAAYRRENEEIFAPMLRLFALVREIGTAISHEAGAFG